jgi:hypothetical protein
MRSLLAIAVLAGCGGGPRPAASPPPPDGTTRGLKMSPGTGSGSAHVATNDPCEGGEVAMFGDLKTVDTRPSSSGGTSGQLSAEDINRVIKASAGKIKACYQSALASQPDLKGKVVAKFTIGPDGKVVSAAVQGMGAGVDDCVRAAVEQLVFPATGNKSTVSYPFLFNGGG